MRVLVGERAPLRAGEPMIGGIVAISLDADRATVFDVDEDAAVRVAEAADRRMRIGQGDQLGGSMPLRFRKSWISHWLMLTRPGKKFGMSFARNHSAATISSPSISISPSL